MSISMESFAATGMFATYDPYRSESDRVAVFQMQCRCCGYEPEDVVRAPRTCPKCHAQSWERFTRPGSILDNSERL